MNMTNIVEKSGEGIGVDVKEMPSDRKRLRDFELLENPNEVFGEKLFALVDKIDGDEFASLFYIQHGPQWIHICEGIAGLRTAAEFAAKDLKDTYKESEVAKKLEGLSKFLKEYQRAYDTWGEAGYPIDPAETWSELCDAGSNAREAFSNLKNEIGNYRADLDSIKQTGMTEVEYAEHVDNI